MMEKASEIYKTWKKSIQRQERKLIVEELLLVARGLRKHHKDKDYSRAEFAAGILEVAAGRIDKENL